jgi:molecular chaperone GrpE
MENANPEQHRAAQTVRVQLSEELDEADEWQSKIERLQEENERLNHEYRREHEMYIRNLADFDAYRRRVERERAQAAQASKRELIQPLLEVMDELEQAIEHANGDPQSAPAGLRAIHRRLAGLLATQSLEDVDSKRNLSTKRGERP